jgi:hypothetical protein
MRDVKRYHRYFEAHVTVEPIFDEAMLWTAEEFAKIYKFRLANLLMQKRSQDTPERSMNDMFFTSRSWSWKDIEPRTKEFVSYLQRSGVKVWRYKIEYTMFDSMYQHSLILDKEGLPEKYANPRPPVTN